MKQYLNSPPGKGPIVCVSAAPGATGSVVVQIAKNLLGASKVIGISGSSEKCQWVEKLGADICVNYKDPNYQDQIEKFLGDEFIDTYFDNVGGYPQLCIDKGQEVWKCCCLWLYCRIQ